MPTNLHHNALVLRDLLEEAFAQVLYLRGKLSPRQRRFTKPSTKELLDRIRPFLSDPDLKASEL